MSSLGKSFRLSSTLKIEEEAMVITKNQGIGSILGSDISDETSTKSSSSSSSSSSLRRTLSADMSSTKCLTQHGFFSPTKKMASSEAVSIFSIVDSSEEDTETETETEQQSQFDMWSSIQDDVCEKKKQAADEKTSQFDMWSSLIQQKSQEEPQPPPYIHPLVKRSASSLSKKSLEICTESLGSETGSESFSSYPASESGDVTEDDDDKETEAEQEEEGRVEQSSEKNLEQEGFHPNYNYDAAAKKSPPPPPPPQRSFPPPIPSCLDGASVRMQSRRDNGRLFLEAVSIPCTNSLLAQRQDGRLVLTLSSETLLKTTEQEEEEEEEDKKEVEELEEEFESFDDEDDGSDEWEEETEEDEGEIMRGVKEEAAGFVMEEQAPKSAASRVINVHGLTLMGLSSNRDPTWPNKFNESVRFDEVEEDIKPVLVAKSLPPMARLIPKSPAAAAAATGTVTTAAMAGGVGGGGGGRGGASFNAYEYYWRPKSMTTQSKGSKSCSNNSMENNKEQQQQIQVLRGNKGENLVPQVKSCKEPRRSLLFWEPYCIATS